jgi:general secretion pathway protein I
VRTRNDQLGLTLVEVLVALAILGLVVSSVMALISQNTRFLATAEERLIAGVLLDNEMIETLARSTPLDLGEQEREAELGGRAWTIESAVVEAGVDGLISIQIEVRDAARRQVAASGMTLKAQPK